MTVKRFGQIIFFTIIAVIMSMSFSFTVCAAGQAEISAPKEISAGSDFTVKINVSADENIGSVMGMLSYDDSVIKFKSSDFASGGGGVLNLNGFPDSVSKKMAITLNFTAIENGTCQIDLTNCYLTSPEGTQIGAPTASANISVSGNANSTAQNDSVELNSNGDPDKGYLTNITVSVGTLKPAFAHDIYDYHVDVESNVEKCEIEGTTANPTDSIWYTGNEELFEGDNVRTIKVTDTDGNYHVYTITITKAKGENTSKTESIENAENQQTSVSSAADTSKSQLLKDTENGMDRYKKILTPALVIILIALIIALIAIITWLRKKTPEENTSKTNSKSTKSRKK